MSVLIPKGSSKKKRNKSREEEIFFVDETAPKRESAHSRLWARAVQRVDREPSLRPYRYLLTDHWAIVSPPVPMWMAKEKENDITVQLHYRWVFEGKLKEVLEWAKERERVYKQWLMVNFEALIQMIFSIPGHGEKRARTMWKLLDYKTSGLLACEDGRLAEAAGYMRETLGLIDRQFGDRLREVESRALVNIKKAHAKRYGTPEEKEQRWESFQKYIQFIHQRAPKMDYGEKVSQTAKHFHVSEKTIRRRTTRPL